MEKVRLLGTPQRGPNNNTHGKSQNIHSFVWFIFYFVKPDQASQIPETGSWGSEILCMAEEESGST